VWAALLAMWEACAAISISRRSFMIAAAAVEGKRHQDAQVCKTQHPQALSMQD